MFINSDVMINMFGDVPFYGQHISDICASKRYNVFAISKTLLRIIIINYWNEYYRNGSLVSHREKYVKSK